MKRLLILLFCCCIPWAFSLSAAAQDTAAFTAPSGYVSAKAGQDYSALATALQKSADEVAALFDENDLIQLAVAEKDSGQIALCVATDDFSRSTVSFSRFSEEELTELAEDLIPNDFTFQSVVTGTDGNAYIQFTASKNGYRITEYLTVCKAEIYTLNLILPTGSTVDEDAVFATLFVADEITNQDKSSLLYTVLAIAGIAVSAAVIAVLGYTVIRDLRRTEK